MENELRKHQNSSRRKALIFGMLITGTGLVLLGLNCGWFNASLKPVIFSWQMLLIVVGLYQAFNRNFLSSLILFSIGIFFLLPKLAMIYPDQFPGVSPDFTATYWPVLLIIAGIFFLLHYIFPDRFKSCYYTNWHHQWKTNSSNLQELNSDSGENNSFNSFSRSVVFGNIQHIFLDETFPGGDIESVFSGVILDLRKTKLAEGNTYLKIDAVFSGVTLYVPNDWNVITRFDSVFGGVSDKRILQQPVDKVKTLVIGGDMVFSGVEIK